MTAIRTHYDNLQIKRTARIEVIKAAYKGLTQRYHPDRNPDDRERCERVMKLINRAYEVLSDPDRRAEYDAFVAREEATANEQQQKVASSEPAQRAGTTASNAAHRNRATPANNSSSQKTKTATPSSGRATASPSTERPSVWKNAGQVLGALILGVYWWSRLANPTPAPMVINH